MYQQSGGPPMYGMYGYDPRMGDPGQPRGRQERESAPVKFTEGKLFIGGVEASMISKDELVEYCSAWGDVKDAVVMDRKGYGFVTFADPKNAMAFLEQRVHELKGRRLDAKAAVPKAHLGSAKLTKKMFVGGTGELTDQDLREHFAQYGEIEDAAVVRREGQSRGFGFVTFRDELSVEKCLLVNHFIKGRKVELKRAVPKDEVLAAQGVPMMGFPPGHFSGQPGMMQQQFYPMPYGPGPAPYGMRPGFPPHPAGPMHMAGDPYGWYGMGYMPYYPAAGMYPTPYGMVPQPGMAGPYGGGVHGHHYMPAPGMHGPRGPQHPSSSSGGTGHELGSSSRGGGGGGASSSRGGGAGAGGGGASSSTEGGAGARQQQQQHGEPHAASPAGPVPHDSGAPPGVRRVSSDPAASSSQQGGASSSSSQPPGLPPASSSSGGASAAMPAGASRPGRGPVLSTFPSTAAGMRPAAGPAGQRPVGPGLMPFAAAAAGVPPGAGLVGFLPPGFTPRSPVVPAATQPPAAAGSTGPPQQQPAQQQHQQQ